MSYLDRQPAATRTRGDAARKLCACSCSHARSRLRLPSQKVAAHVSVCPRRCARTMRATAPASTCCMPSTYTVSPYSSWTRFAWAPWTLGLKTKPDGRFPTLPSRSLPTFVQVVERALAMHLSILLEKTLFNLEPVVRCVRQCQVRKVTAEPRPVAYAASALLRARYGDRSTVRDRGRPPAAVRVVTLPTLASP